MESIPNISKHWQGVVPSNGISISKNCNVSQNEPEIPAVVGDDLNNRNIPIASKDKECTSEATALLNKYHYPEFAGRAGEAYLASLVLQILPRALKETWEAATSYQAAGNTCYVSSARMRNDLKVQSLDESTLRKHWQAFRDRKLVAFVPVIKQITDKHGTHSAAVVEKDFRGLYDLAHEFHEWLASGSYAQIPPRREYAEAIRMNEALADKLVRFECYRKILLNEAPGPKPQRDYAQQLAAKLRAKAAEDNSIVQKNAKREMYPATYPAMYPPYPKNKDSSKRDILPNSDGSAALGSEGAARTIRNREEQTAVYTETKDTNRDEGTIILYRKTDDPNIQRKGPAPLPEILEKLDNAAIYTQRTVPESYRAACEQIAAKELPVDQLIDELVICAYIWLNDQTDLTYLQNSVKKVFSERLNFAKDEVNTETAQLVLRVMLARLAYAFKLLPAKVQRRNPDGSPNWMPRFTAGLHRAIQVAMFSGGDKRKPVEQTESSDASTQPETPEQPAQLPPVPDQAVEASATTEASTSSDEAIEPTAEPEESPEELEELDVNDPQTLIALAAEYGIALEPAVLEQLEQCNEESMLDVRERLLSAMITQEADRRYDLIMHQTTMQMQRAVKASSSSDPVQFCEASRRCQCGCKIVYLESDQQKRCVRCDPTWRWSLPLRDTLRAIADIPSFEQIYEEVAEEYLEGDSLGDDPA